MARRKSQNGSRRPGNRKTFRTAVLAVPALAGAFQQGVQALTREHRRGLDNAPLATGSMDLDAALQAAFPNDHRWDYGIGLPHDAQTEKVLWLEVHHAASGETERVIRKLQALKTWLAANAPALAAMPRVYIWQLSNTENNPNDRRSRNKLAEQHGLRRVQGVLDLAKV